MGSFLCPLFPPPPNPLPGVPTDVENAPWSSGPRPPSLPPSFLQDRKINNVHVVQLQQTAQARILVTLAATKFTSYGASDVLPQRTGLRQQLQLFLLVLVSSLVSFGLGYATRAFLSKTTIVHYAETSPRWSDDLLVLKREPTRFNGSFEWTSRFRGPPSPRLTVSGIHLRVIVIDLFSDEIQISDL